MAKKKTKPETKTDTLVFKESENDLLKEQFRCRSIRVFYCGILIGDIYFMKRYPDPMFVPADDCYDDIFFLKKMRLLPQVIAKMEEMKKDFA